MKKLIVFICVVCFYANSFAQPFINEIRQFKKEDSLIKPPKKAIIFTGSSSFRLWKGLQDSFPGKKIINRAFGGSSLPHVIMYAEDVILKYKPKQVLIYCGDNDLASSDTVQAKHVLQRFQTLFDLIRKSNRKTHIAFVSIKPSPSRERLKAKMEESNQLIENFLKTKKRAAFIDVYHPMLLADGKSDPSLFIADNLHMNAKGYAIWKRIIYPYLKS